MNPIPARYPELIDQATRAAQTLWEAYTRAINSDFRYPTEVYDQLRQAWRAATAARSTLRRLQRQAQTSTVV